MIVHSIDTEEKVKKKLDMIYSIEDIQVALQIYEDKEKEADESRLDHYWKKLKANVNLLDKSVLPKISFNFFIVN